MPATQVYLGTLLPVVGVFSMAGTFRLIPQSTQCNGALFLRTQIQYKTMKTEQCGFHQRQKENGVAKLKMVVCEQRLLSIIFTDCKFKAHLKLAKYPIRNCF